jgi:O-antigen ligase
LVLYFVGAFLLVTLAYALTARAPVDVLFNASYLGLIPATTLYLLATRNAGRESATWIAALCLAGAAVGLLLAASQWLLIVGFYRATPLFGGPNLLPRIVLPLGFVAAAGAFVIASRWRYLFYLGPVMAIAVTLFSGSRGAAIAIPFMAMCLIVALFANRRDRWLAVAITVAALVLGVLFALLGGDRFATIAAIIGQMVLSSGGAGGDEQVRLYLIRAGALAFLDSPWVGHGWAHLSEASDNHLVSEGARTLLFQPFFQFHNDFVNFAAAAGILGILAGIAILFGPLLDPKAWQRDALFRPRLYCIVVIIVGNLIFGMTDLTLGYDITLTLHAFLSVLVLGAFREARQGDLGDRR